MIRKYIKSRFPVSLYHTVSSHGWVNLAPWLWDAGKCELHRTERLKSGKLVCFKVSQKVTMNLAVEIDAEKLGASDLKEIVSNVTRWLSLEWDPSPAIHVAKKFDPRIALFIEQGGGRFLRSSTFYEDFVKTLCTVNAHWAFTVRMVSSLVNQVGGEAFPTPAQVVGVGEEFLRQNLKLGFRAKVIAELSRWLLDKKVVNDEGNLIGEVPSFDDLIKLRGVGRYSASHIAMLCHDFSHIPIDSEVSRYCETRYKIDSWDIEPFFETWGEYKFLGYKVGRILDDTNWAG